MKVIRKPKESIILSQVVSGTVFERTDAKLTNFSSVYMVCHEGEERFIIDLVTGKVVDMPSNLKVRVVSTYLVIET